MTTLPERQRRQTLLWVAVSGIAFLLSLVVTILLYLGAQNLSRYGLTRSAYFSVLIALALCSAAFLFGAMHSYARYSGTHPFFGRLELGGPVVVSILIIVLGLKFAAPATKIDLVVRVHGPQGAADIIRTGQVTLDAGTARRTQDIGASGEAHFNEIPISFAGEKVQLILKSEDYRTKDNFPIEIPANGVLDLEVEPIPQSCAFHGDLRYPDGRPVVNASVVVEDGMATGNTNDG